MNAAERPFVVDRVVAVCKGCQGERTFVIDPPLRSAQAFVAWKEGPNCPLVRCGCGATHCDLKLMLVDQN